MQVPAVDDASVADARDVAAEAAARAGVRIADLHDHPDMPAVSRLFDDVWGREPGAGTLMVSEALTALAHAGGQVTGAYRGALLVGATAAFLGLTDDGEVFLHSHITGVLVGEVGRGVGRALKWHQRAWCLARGIGRVRWTFDPLVRRNARFNLVRLGAQVTGYREDVYGRAADAINAGLPTDRLVVDWDLGAPRVVAAAGDRTAEPDVDALRRSGAEVAVRVGADDAPEVTSTTAPRRLVQIPADIEALRARRPDLAAAWGEAVRAALGGALADGLRLTGFHRDGWYVLAGDRSVHELARGA